MVWMTSYLITQPVVSKIYSEARQSVPVLPTASTRTGFGSHVYLMHFFNIQDYIYVQSVWFGIEEIHYWLDAGPCSIC